MHVAGVQATNETRLITLYSLIDINNNPDDISPLGNFFTSDFFSSNKMEMNFRFFIVFYCVFYSTFTVSLFRLLSFIVFLLFFNIMFLCFVSYPSESIEQEENALWFPYRYLTVFFLYLLF